MPATWTVEIQPLNVSRYEASITATRTDGDDMRVFYILSAILQSPQQQLDVLNNIWGQWLASKAESAAVTAFIGNLAATGKAMLEAREVL